MAILPLSSESNPKEALRQIDLNFRDIAAKLNSLEKKIKKLENDN